MPEPSRDQNGRKMRSRSAASIPGPVSRTATEIEPLSAPSSSSIRPPSGVQRNAFESRFVMIWSTRSPSVWIVGRAPISCRYAIPRRRASSANELYACSQRRSISTSSSSSVKRCASSFARSSTSPTSRSSRPAASAITSSDCPASSRSSITPSESAETWPRIAVSGVRSSCETVIRKLRSIFSASPRRWAICEKLLVSWPISPPPRTWERSTS